MTDPVSTPENRVHLGEWEKEIRTKGVGFIQCMQHGFVKINTDFF